MRDYYDGVLSKLISAREEAGLTQREVSLRLGMAHSFMNKCETGERAIDVAELWAIGKIYGKPMSFFAKDEPLTRELSSEIRASDTPLL
jgi:transcriptional regulator with XRE-family HTH domain